MYLDEYQPLDQNPIYKNTSLPHSRRSPSVLGPPTRAARSTPPTPSSRSSSSSHGSSGGDSDSLLVWAADGSFAAATAFIRGGDGLLALRPTTSSAAARPSDAGGRRPRSRRRPAASSAAAVRVPVPIGTARHDEALVVPCPGRVLGTAALRGTARQCRRAPPCHAPPCRAPSCSCSCPCRGMRPVWPPIQGSTVHNNFGDDATGRLNYWGENVTSWCASGKKSKPTGCLTSVST